MKNMLLTLTVFVILSLNVLSSCGSGGSDGSSPSIDNSGTTTPVGDNGSVGGGDSTLGNAGNSNAGSNSDGTTANYSPKTLGSTWTYLITTASSYTASETDTIIQSSITRYLLKYYFSSVTDYGIDDIVQMSNGTWGISKETYYNAKGTVLFLSTFAPPSILEPSNWSVGTRESYTFTLTQSGVSSTSGTDIDVVGFEVVTVPAGTFNALKITFTNSVGGTITNWYVDGIGCVKSVYPSNQINVLTNFTIR
jgi:hypothetical protein